MGVYQVIFETERDNEIIDQHHYWEAPDFETVAKAAIDHAASYKHEVKLIRYLFNIVQRFKKENT